MFSRSSPVDAGLRTGNQDWLDRPRQATVSG